MFVEEGFRIRFANGEVIDFYADSTAGKDEWMQALCQVVGKGIASTSSKDGGKAWTEMVLKREKSSMRQQNDSHRKADIPPRQSSSQQQQYVQPQPAPMPAQRPKSPVRQQTVPMASGIPSPAAKRPVINPRQSTGHMRTESFQPSPNHGARSQANSPVKSKFGFGISSEERRRKARSMLM